MFSRKIRHVAIRSGSIRWISIRFDAVKRLLKFFEVNNSNEKCQQATVLKNF